MNRYPCPRTPVALAAAAALMLHAGGALAQAAAAPAVAASSPAAAAEPMSLDRVVVTGTALGGTKMKQSVSVSTVEGDLIANSGAGSAAEILRLVPGVHAENSGGEGNANVSVRGVPISAGGSRYVQFQEDGLPVLIFGDVAFGTPDQFIRADYNVDHLEVLRGGSASTLASNAPGGVINFISKTGSEAGGNIGLTQGVGSAGQTRLDIDYGARLGSRTRFHIGGFSRTGEGDRPTGFTAANGGQLRANITQQLDNGFIRLSFKALDDRTPTYLPVPVTVSNGHIAQIPGIDPRTAFFISPSFGPDNVFGKDGSSVTTNPKDGLHVKSTALGAEAQFELGEGWSVNDKFRKTANSGRFIGMFPANNGDGATPATSTTFTGTLFNTSINDLGNTLNELRLSKAFGDAKNGGKTTLTAGLFSAVQDVALTWFWNQYTVDMKNNGAGATLLHTGWDTWGGCCVRNFDVQYVNSAPYAAVNFELDALSIDASVRHDSQKASGWAESGDTETRNAWNSAGQQKVDYSVSHTSYSVGANYQLGSNLALFARASDGVAFAADRLLYGNPLDGSVPISLNEVKQIEAGAKFRSGGLNLFATLFNARTTESNYEATTQKFTANTYDANGLELELGYRVDAFKMTGGATFTQSRIKSSNDAATVGNTPRRVSDLVLQASPSYQAGPLEFGGTLIYNGKAWGDDANTITLPAYTVLNVFANYAVNDRTQLSLGVNNLGNALGYTEIEGDGHAARAINGRTVKLGLKYSF